LHARTCKNRGATRVSATVGNAAAVASSAIGSPSCSIMNPVVTKRFSQLLNVRWNRGTRKGGVKARSSAGGAAEMPSLDPAVAAGEIIRHLHSNGNALGVSDAPTSWWAKAGVQDRKLQKAIGAEDAMRFTQGKPVVGHVHQRHEGSREIKAGIAERKVGATCHLIYDTAAR